MNPSHLTAAISTAIAALTAGAVFSQSTIAQTSTTTSTPISPTAPYNIQSDPNGNVQIYPGNVTQPTSSTGSPGVQNNGTSTGTAGTTSVTTTPISPTAPAGVQSSSDGNVQVFPGNNVQTGGTSTGITGTTGVTTTPISPTAPAGVQSSPNGNVQVFPGSNVQTGGSQTTTPNAPGIIQIVPTNPSGTPQSTALPGTTIVIQSPTGGTPSQTPQNSQPSQPSQSQTVPGGGTLDAQLLQATCNQNWGQAIQIVNRAIAAAPANSSEYRAQLSSYRTRLQTLQNRGIRVPNWQQQCTQGFVSTQLAGR